MAQWNAPELLSPLDEHLKKVEIFFFFVFSFNWNLSLILTGKEEDRIFNCWICEVSMSLCLGKLCLSGQILVILIIILDLKSLDRITKSWFMIKKRTIIHCNYLRLLNGKIEASSRPYRYDKWPPLAKLFHFTTYRCILMGNCDRNSVYDK